MHLTQLAADACGAAQGGPVGRVDGATCACVHNAHPSSTNLPAPRREAYKVPPGQGGVLVRKVYPVGSAAGQLQEGDVLQRQGRCRLALALLVVGTLAMYEPRRAVPGSRVREGVTAAHAAKVLAQHKHLRRLPPACRFDGTDIAPDGSVPFRTSERISLSEACYLWHGGIACHAHPTPVIVDPLCACRVAKARPAARPSRALPYPACSVSNHYEVCGRERHARRPAQWGAPAAQRDVRAGGS